MWLASRDPVSAKRRFVLVDLMLILLLKFKDYHQKFGNSVFTFQVSIPRNFSGVFLSTFWEQKFGSAAITIFS